MQVLGRERRARPCVGDRVCPANVRFAMCPPCPRVSRRARARVPVSYPRGVASSQNGQRRAGRVPGSPMSRLSGSSRPQEQPSQSLISIGSPSRATRGLPRRLRSVGGRTGAPGHPLRTATAVACIGTWLNPRSDSAAEGPCAFRPGSVRVQIGASLEEQHGPDERDYDEDQLVPVGADARDGLLGALADGAFVDPVERVAKVPLFESEENSQRGDVTRTWMHWANHRVRVDCTEWC
jgi:hypothetical protein